MTPKALNREQYEFENKVLEKILSSFKEATVWGNDGFQIQIVNLLRDTIQVTKDLLTKENK